MISRLSAWMKGGDTAAATRTDAAVNRTVVKRMFWLGLVIRVIYITVAHSYRFRLIQDHFQFGWEMGRIGRALATGHGFADPFMGHSGPTAWCPPLYPLLLGATFKLFGVYTPLSAWVVLTVNSIFSAATAVAIYEIGWRNFDRKVALWSGWLWALYPAAMQYAVHWVWDMAITTCLFAWVLVVALRVRRIGDASADDGSSQTAGQATALWAAFGLLWGMIALLNSSLLTFLPWCGIWMVWPAMRSRQRLGPAIARAALAASLCAACILPWTVRNWVVFHAFVPMRGNLGSELYQSSLEINNGFPWGGTVSILEDTPDMQRYRDLGEIGFSKERSAMAKAVFAAHPGRFERYTLKRIYFFWVGVPHPVEKGLFLELAREWNYGFLSVGGLLGLVLAGRRLRPAVRPAVTLYAGAFLLLPVAYYLVTVQARFRAPLEPLICVLTVYLFQSAERGRVWSWSKALRSTEPAESPGKPDVIRR